MICFRSPDPYSLEPPHGSCHSLRAEAMTFGGLCLTMNRAPSTRDNAPTDAHQIRPPRLAHTSNSLPTFPEHALQSRGKKKRVNSIIGVCPSRINPRTHELLCIHGSYSADLCRTLHSGAEQISSRIKSRATQRRLNSFDRRLISIST